MKYSLPSALRQAASASRQSATSSVRQQTQLFRLSTRSSSCINTARNAANFGSQKSTTQLTPSPLFRRLINSSANAKNIALDSAAVSAATAEPVVGSSAGSLPGLTTPAVANWLYISSGLVFFIIVVGGVTRLTESGLSITEWEPVKGILPPIGQEQWAVEWEKYKVTPEGVITNSQLDMESFKKIFYMEWAHRLAGRVLGVG
jgi:cytochrome c oxidase assembly protein subunit 15